LTLGESREAISNIVDYYSYLVTFPSRLVMVASIIVVSGVVGAVAFGLSYGTAGLSQGLIYGLLGLAAPVIVSDALIDVFYGDDPLLTPRRVTIISFVWCLVGGLILVIVGVISGLTGRPDLLLRGVLLAVYSSAALRMIVFSVFSTRDVFRTTLAVAAQPVLIAVATQLLLPGVWQAPLSVMAIVLALMLLGPAILLIQVSRMSFEDGAIRIIPLFRAFIYAWAEQHNEPLEEQLVEISESARLEVDELVFTDPFGTCLGRVVAPYIHPGPFRNVGSSGLSLILTDGLDGCETIVAHGVSSHERDMAQSTDMKRVLSALEAAEMPKTQVSCSPMTRTEVSGAKASCQIFGETALFTLTLSPKSHDDIPSAAKDRVRSAAAVHGLNAIVIDAHNCLDHEDLLDEKDVENLIAAAEEALEKAVKLPREPFKVGISRVRPAEWRLNEGMGPCGIATVVIETTVGKNAYIVFDTNNMIQGFREKLLGHVASLGYIDAEALTSDTHLVNAIGATDRGYHPAGEAMEQSSVLRYVEELLGAAKPRPAEVSFTRVAVDDVPIIGADGIELLMIVVKTSFRVFVRTAAAALPLTFLAAMATALLA
jgi:putative membrane protein